MELTNHGIGKRALALLLTAVLALSLCATVIETRAEETYTVTFELNQEGAVFTDGFSGSVTVSAGETVQFPSAYGSQKNKTILTGWKAEGTEKIFPVTFKVPPVYHDITFTAIWESKSSEYDLIFEPGEGAVGKNSVVRTSFFDKVKLPDATNIFIPPEGKQFSHWKGKYDKIYSQGTELQILGDNTLVAVWENKTNSEPKVFYHYNPPTGQDNIKPQGRWNGEIPSSQFSSFTTPEGYEFAGWSRDFLATEGDPDCAPGNTIPLDKDVHLYAVWVIKEYPCKVTTYYLGADGKTLEWMEESSVNLRANTPLNSYKAPKDITLHKDGTDYRYLYYTISASGNVSSSGTNQIYLYYDINELCDGKYTTERVDKLTGGDNYADKYQKKITYKIENGKWDDDSNEEKFEVVTLIDGRYLSQTGTAELEVPTVGASDSGYGEGRWSTPDGSAPTTVDESGPFEYTYHFLNESETIIITPVTVTAEYDGTEHTFKEFEAKKNGSAVTVTLKNDKSLAGHGRTDVTDSSNQTIDLASELVDNWRDYFTMTGEDIENAILMPGTIIVTPKQVDVKISIDDSTFNDRNLGFKCEYDKAEKELIFSYRYDALEHTLKLESGVCALEGIVDGDKGQVSLCLPGTAGVPTVGVEHVDEGKETIDLKAEKFSLEGDRAGNYTIGKVDVSATISGAKTGDVQVDKLSVKITPRPVNYWTFGGSKIYNGSVFEKNASVTTPEGTHDGTPPADKKKNVAYDWPDYESAYDTLTDGAETKDNGFIVRREGNNGYTFQQAENEWPQSLEPNNESDAGIYDYVIKIAAYIDDATNGRENVQKNDYDVIEHNSYLTIYPQSITDNKDTQYHDVTTYISDTIAEYDPHVVEYTYLDREAGKAPENADKFPAFYTGVKLTDDFVESYPYDGKPHIAEAGALRNDNNAEGKQDLTEGTDYTVTYYRQDDKGVWNEISDEKDFVEPGKIKIVYQGIGNYRNRIEKEYSIVSGNGGLIPPDPPTPGGPDVELDDHDHYAYIIGKPGGIVAPNGEITRAEIATVIFRLLKEEVREQYWSKENSFPDVEITDWYNNAVSTLEKLGVVAGKDDGLFHPDDPITRAEMATMMVRLYDYDVDTGGFHTKFDDVGPAAWYARYVAAAEELALFLGDGSTSHFYPDRSLTRAEAMTVYNRLLGRKPHKDGLLPEKQMILWPDNMDATAWYYADVQEATNSHTCVIDGLAVGGERFERWLSPLPVRDWAALEQAWSEAHSGYDGHDVN